MRLIESALGHGVVEDVDTIDAKNLALTLVANFRAHPHVCNVMTHISGGSWPKVEKALVEILDRERAPAKLSKLAANIVDLACAERGVTGRIFKPFLQQLLSVTVSAAASQAIRAHLDNLFAGLNEPARLAQATPAAPADPIQTLVEKKKLDRDPAFCASATSEARLPAMVA